MKKNTTTKNKSKKEESVMFKMTDTRAVKPEDLKGSTARFVNGPSNPTVVAKTEEEQALADKCINPDNLWPGPKKVVAEEVILKFGKTASSLVTPISTPGQRTLKVHKIDKGCTQLIEMGLKPGMIVLAATNAGYMTSLNSRTFWTFYELDVISIVGEEKL